MPEVFDVPVLDLVAATGDEEFRRATGYSLSPAQRWRLQRRARRLVRPGVEVDDRQLHRLLSAAAAQRLDWQTISEGSGWAHLPASHRRHGGPAGRAAARLRAPGPAAPRAPPGLPARWRRCRTSPSACSRRPTPWTTCPAAPCSSSGSPSAAGRPCSTGCAGLDPGAVSPQAAARELRLAWWTGVAEATAPSLSDRAATSEAAERYASSQRSWVAAAPARVRAAREAVDPRARLTDPVRVLVPADVAALPPEEQVDVVVLDDAGRAGFAEACGALARTAQVVALGDLGVARTGSALTVLGDCLPLDRLRTGHRTHQPALAGLAAVAGSTAGPQHRARPRPEPAVTRTFVEAAVGLPEGDAEAVDTTEAEVDHVVRETLRLVAELAAADPPRSVAVVALTRSPRGRGGGRRPPGGARLPGPGRGVRVRRSPSRWSWPRSTRPAGSSGTRCC